MKVYRISFVHAQVRLGGSRGVSGVDGIFPGVNIGVLAPVFRKGPELAYCTYAGLGDVMFWWYLFWRREALPNTSYSHPRMPLLLPFFAANLFDSFCSVCTAVGHVARVHTLLVTSSCVLFALPDYCC